MLREILKDREDAIVGQWLDRVLAVYPPEGADAFRRGEDRFGNPVGHTARETTRALFGALLADEPDREALAPLAELLRIRAVQQMPASMAVGFILELKTVVRAELSAWWSSELETALRDLEGRIDRLALDAFDIYVGYRDELARLKVQEARRHVAWIVERLNRGEAPEPDPADGDREGDAGAGSVASPGDAGPYPSTGVRLPVLDRARVRNEVRP